MHLTVGVFAFSATVLLMFVLRPLAIGVGLVDVPGGRKRHGVEVPLIGGLAISLAIGLSSTFSEQPAFFLPTIMAVSLLVFVGTIDDKYDLPANVRLVAHTVAAMLVVYAADIRVSSLEESFFMTVQLGRFADLFTLLFIVTLINAFNVIDGIDGLAGGLSLVGLSALALLASGCDVFGLAFVSSFAVVGFLIFNLPLGINRSVRSFLGDAGSTTLGLIIAAVGIAVSQSPICEVAPVVGLWLVAIPVFDLFSVTIRRVIQGRSPFAPDHEHLHHVLIVEGMSARSVLVVMLFGSIVCAGIGLAGHYAGASQGLMLMGWLVGLALYYQAMRRPGLVVSAVAALSSPPRFGASGS